MGTMSDHGLTSTSTPSDHGVDLSLLGSGSGVVVVADEPARLALTPSAGDLVFQEDNTFLYICRVAAT
jgi:hypothetical protein